MVPAVVRAMQARAESPPEIHSPEELEAYAAQQLAEVDALIAEIEEALKDAKGMLKAWLEGALKGLQVARAAWSVWKRG